MKIACLLVIFSFALWEGNGFPYNPYYGNVDSLSYGSSGRSHGGMVMSRAYNPYQKRAASGGTAAFMVPQAARYSQYNRAVRRQAIDDTNFVSPQENEVFYPEQPHSPAVIPTEATEATEIADPTEKAEVLTTPFVPVVPDVKSTAVPVVPELSEPEVLEDEEPVPKSRNAVPTKKQVKTPVDDDEEDDDTYPARMPAGAFFPMFFGWGGRSGGAPGGPIAISNSYSTGRGGVSTSHASAGEIRPQEKL